jgi:hypothetical protein
MGLALITTVLMVCAYVVTMVRTLLVLGAKMTSPE